MDDAEESYLQEHFASIDNDIDDNFQPPGDKNCDSAAFNSGFGSVQYGDLSDEMAKINDVKCVASINQLRALVGTSCRFSGCEARLLDIKHHILQYCVKVEWTCFRGHCEFWYSSPFYGAGFSINYIVDTCVMLSGG